MSRASAKAETDLYGQLLALPEALVGEILDGQLHTQPRPAWRHLRAASRLDRLIGGRYDDGDGGPGGWWIVLEPEVHFLRDREVAVPDLAGWRRARMPQPPEGHRVEVVPDWVCEVLSPATESRDREIKMPLYARHGVGHAWLVDPGARTLEAFALEGGAWRAVSTCAGDNPARIQPFEAVTLVVDRLWT